MLNFIHYILIAVMMFFSRSTWVPFRFWSTECIVTIKWASKHRQTIENFPEVHFYNTTFNIKTSLIGMHRNNKFAEMFVNIRFDQLLLLPLWLLVTFTIEMCVLVYICRRTIVARNTDSDSGSSSLLATNVHMYVCMCACVCVCVCSFGVSAQPAKIRPSNQINFREKTINREINK